MDAFNGGRGVLGELLEILGAGRRFGALIECLGDLVEERKPVIKCLLC